MPYEKIVYKDVQVPVEIPVEKVCTLCRSVRSVSVENISVMSWPFSLSESSVEVEKDSCFG